MTVGAHYLTDVTIAGLVTMLAYIIVSLITRSYHLKCNGKDILNSNKKSIPKGAVL